MDGIEAAVLAGALGGIGWINGYFFLGEREASEATATTDGTQEFTVVVRGGYQPGVLKARAGSPVRIRFDRQETSGCSEEVVFPDFGVKRFLPAFETTVVEVVPGRAGTYPFTCGMGMLQGRLVVDGDAGEG